MIKKIIITLLGVSAVAIVVLFLFKDKTIPQVQASDQPIKNGKVVVAQVEAIAPSWLVIQVEMNGLPGTVIGYKKINKGVSKDVEVDIDPKTATPKLYAMIHQDTGEKDKFDFPNNDMPLMYKGEMVSSLFALQ